MIDYTVPTNNAGYAPSFSVLSNGQPIAELANVLAVRVNRSLYKIPEAEIVLLDGDVSKADFVISSGTDLTPGNEIEIQAGYKQQNTTIFKGIIVKQTIKITKQGSQLTLLAKNPVFITAIGRKSAVFMNMKDSDIINQVLSNAQIACNVDDTGVQQEQMIQFNATDWDFINMRAEANGLLVNVLDDQVAIHAPNTGASPKLSLKYGVSIIEGEAEIDARNTVPDTKVASWSYTDQQVDFGSPNLSALTEEGDLSASNLAKSLNIQPLQISNGGKLLAGEMTSLANSAKIKGTLSKIDGKIRCIGFAGIMPGDILDVEGVGLHFSGNAFINGVFHDISGGKWETVFMLGMNNKPYAEWYSDSLTKPASGLLPSVCGLQVGTVSQIVNDPDGEDRILVKIPIADATNDAVWARVAALDAGNKRGSFFRPEQNDEVILGFINDDPRQAIVLGMLNSSKLPAPLTANANNTQKGFVTRENMQLIFDDDKKSVTISTPAGNQIVISDSQQSITVSDQNNNTITMSSNGIAISSGSALNISAQGDITIQGNNVSLNANASFSAQGTSGASVQSNGTTALQGMMVNIN